MMWNAAFGLKRKKKKIELPTEGNQKAKWPN